jgi:hypothetical protein
LKLGLEAYSSARIVCIARGSALDKLDKAVEVPVMGNHFCLYWSGADQPRETQVLAWLDSVKAKDLVSNSKAVRGK